VAGFRVEAEAGNTGYGFALTTLQEDFSDPDQDGPIRAAEFHPGNTSNRDRIRQDGAIPLLALRGRSQAAAAGHWLVLDPEVNHAMADPFSDSALAFEGAQKSRTSWISPCRPAAAPANAAEDQACLL